MAISLKRKGGDDIEYEKTAFDTCGDCIRGIAG